MRLQNEGTTYKSDGALALASFRSLSWARCRVPRALRGVSRRAPARLSAAFVCSSKPASSASSRALHVAWIAPPSRAAAGRSKSVFCQTARNIGSDSHLLHVAADLALFSKRNQRHGSAVSASQPRSCGIDRRRRRDGTRSCPCPGSIAVAACRCASLRNRQRYPEPNWGGDCSIALKASTSFPLGRPLCRNKKIGTRMVGLKRRKTSPVP